MSTPQTERLRALLEPLAAESGLDVEDVKITQAGNRRQVQVDVDADGGVDLDAIAEFSRVVGQALIPERSRAHPARDTQDVVALLTSEWALVKQNWK